MFNQLYCCLLNVIGGKFLHVACGHVIFGADIISLFRYDPPRTTTQKWWKRKLCVRWEFVVVIFGVCCVYMWQLFTCHLSPPPIRQWNIKTRELVIDALPSHIWILHFFRSSGCFGKLCSKQETVTCQCEEEGLGWVRKPFESEIDATLATRIRSNLNLNSKISSLSSGIITKV